MEKYIFLDKDGTLIHDVPYNIELADIHLYSEVVMPLRILSAAGYKFIIISNQAGIAKGYFNKDQLHKAFAHLISVLHSSGVTIAAFYYCPHREEQNPPCSCRKPQPGMLHQAAREHNISLADSWMIGDILADVGAGLGAGCKTILVDRDGEQRRLLQHRGSDFRPDYIVDKFTEVDSIILKHKLHDDEYTHEQSYSML